MKVKIFSASSSSPFSFHIEDQNSNSNEIVEDSIVSSRKSSNESSRESNDSSRESNDSLSIKCSKLNDFYKKYKNHSPVIKAIKILEKEQQQQQQQPQQQQQQQQQQPQQQPQQQQQQQQQQQPQQQPQQQQQQQQHQQQQQQKEKKITFATKHISIQLDNDETNETKKEGPKLKKTSPVLPSSIKVSSVLLPSNKSDNMSRELEKSKSDSYSDTPELPKNNLKKISKIIFGEDQKEKLQYYINIILIIKYINIKYECVLILYKEIFQFYLLFASKEEINFYKNNRQEYIQVSDIFFNFYKIEKIDNYLKKLNEKNIDKELIEFLDSIDIYKVKSEIILQNFHIKYFLYSISKMTTQNDKFKNIFEKNKDKYINFNNKIYYKFKKKKEDPKKTRCLSFCNKENQKKASCFSYCNNKDFEKNNNTYINIIKKYIMSKDLILFENLIHKIFEYINAINVNYVHSNYLQGVVVYIKDYDKFILSIPKQINSILDNYKNLLSKYNHLKT
jgi:hypothetical protein